MGPEFVTCHQRYFTKTISHHPLLRIKYFSIEIEPRINLQFRISLICIRIQLTYILIHHTNYLWTQKKHTFRRYWRYSNYGQLNKIFFIETCAVIRDFSDVRGYTWTTSTRLRKICQQPINGSLFFLLSVIRNLWGYVKAVLPEWLYDNVN
jgi:hypothetical protein